MYLNKSFQVSDFSVHTVEVNSVSVYPALPLPVVIFLLFSLIAELHFFLLSAKIIYWAFLNPLLSSPLSEGGINLEFHEDIVICPSTTW